MKHDYDIIKHELYRWETAKYIKICNLTDNKFGQNEQASIFSFLSEVGARGLLNLGKKHFQPSNWEDLNWTTILNGLKTRN